MKRQWVTDICRIRELSSVEMLFGIRAYVTAPFVEVSLAKFGFQRTLSWIENLSEHPQSLEENQREGVGVERAEKIIAGVYRWHWLKGQCLPRSLLQYFLHRRDGQKVRFVIGVRKEGSSQPLDAHGWVEGETTRDFPFSPIFQAQE